jgi:hypothetical protein
VKGIQVCSNKRGSPLQRVDNHRNVKMGWGHLKSSVEPLGQFNQTWHKSSLEGGFKSVQRKGIAPLQEEIIAKE